MSDDFNHDPMPEWVLPDDDVPVQAARPKPPGTPATFLLLAINLAVLAAAYYNGAPVFEPDTRTLVKWGANYGSHTMNGELWRLLTATFVNLGPVWVIALNTYVLWMAGRSIERLLGSVRFACIYLLSGTGCHLAALCWSPRFTSSGNGGAIMGMIGALIAFFVCNRRWFPVALIRQQMGQLIFSIIITLGINAAASGDASGIAGGIVTGILCGFAFVKVNPGENYWKFRQTLGIVLLLAGFAATGYFASKRFASPAVIQAAKNAVREQLKVGKAHIEYSSDFTKATAERLGDELDAMGWTKSAATVFLTKENGTIAVGLVVKDGVWDDSDDLAEMRAVGKRLARKVFENQRIEIHLHDVHATDHKTLKIEPEAIIGPLI